MENRAMKNRYTYGSINRLEKAVNERGVAALYECSGLGHHTEKMEGETKIHYTIDLIRAYRTITFYRKKRKE